MADASSPSTSLRPVVPAPTAPTSEPARATASPPRADGARPRIPRDARLRRRVPAAVDGAAGAARGGVLLRLPEGAERFGRFDEAAAGAPANAIADALLRRVLSVGVEHAAAADLVALVAIPGDGRRGGRAPATSLTTSPSAATPDAARSAWSVLERFGTLRAAGKATPAELAAEAGLDPAAAARLAAAFALGRRAAAEELPRGAPFRSSRDIFDRYHPLLRDARRERFVAVLVDAKNRVLREETVSEGILTSSLVHPREVFGPAVREGAAGLVVVHNHPSGDPEPSPEDVDVTKRLVAAGELVGIRVLDHVVLGDGAYVSFLDRGWIA